MPVRKKTIKYTKKADDEYRYSFTFSIKNNEIINIQCSDTQYDIYTVVPKIDGVFQITSPLIIYKTKENYPTDNLIKIIAKVLEENNSDFFGKSEFHTPGVRVQCTMDSITEPKLIIQILAGHEDSWYDPC